MNWKKFLIYLTIIILLLVVLVFVILLSDGFSYDDHEFGVGFPPGITLDYSEGNCSTDSQCEYAGDGCGGGHGICTNQPDKYEGMISVCDIVSEHPINNGYNCECLEELNKCGWRK